MMMRENSEKRDIRPVLLKFGVALALSLGGILYSVIRTKRIKPSQSPPPPSPSDCGNQVDSEGEKAVMENDYHALQTTSYSCNSPSITADKHEELCLQKVSPPDRSVAGLSPSSRDRGDKDGFLLPELDELVKVFNLAAPKAAFSPNKDVETSHSDVETPGVFTCAEREDHDQEIKDLKEMVRILRERERTLEIQLLEYYSLKEQETTVMELQNRLKINNMESKLFSLKIESLQADNRRLEAQVADYAKVVTELEAARTKIKLLTKKLKTETEQNREQILTLQQRVKKLQDQEHEAVTSDPDIQLNLQQMKDLEEEAEQLRKSNHSLQLENSDLAERLENTQMLATSFLEDQEAEALKAESRQLRQQNEDLLKVIEQLRADRCADVEELVYLRWINACLRYELRNYQPGPGKTIARDLSKTLSPKSEEKAKQLIIEYANKQGGAEKGINIMDYDFDQWSSSHSYLTDSAEFDDSSVDYSSANKTDTSSRTEVLSKLRRLIRGKDGHHHSWSSSAERSAIGEDMEGKSRSSVDAGTDGHGNRLRSSSRYSLDIERLRNLKAEDGKDLGGSLRNCDVGSPYVYRSIVSGSSESVSDSLLENQDHENPGTVQKSEKLVKYAEVLKDSSRERSKLHRRAASHGPFLHF